MGTKGITKDNKFFIMIINVKEGFSEVSSYYAVEDYEKVTKFLMDALDLKEPIYFDNDERHRVVVPYKVLKRANIKLIWEQNN
jgi:hypothetical protein